MYDRTLEKSEPNKFAEWSIAKYVRAHSSQQQNLLEREKRNIYSSRNKEILHSICAQIFFSSNLKGTHIKSLLRMFLVYDMVVLVFIAYRHRESNAATSYD